MTKLPKSTRRIRSIMQSLQPEAWLIRDSADASRDLPLTFAEAKALVESGTHVWVDVGNAWRNAVTPR